MFLLVPLGGIMMLVGAIWLVVIAIQTGQNTGEKVLWALVNFFCQPLGGIIFYIVKKQGLVPLLLVVLGAILYGAGVATSMPDMMRDMR